MWTCVSACVCACVPPSLCLRKQILYWINPLWWPCLNHILSAKAAFWRLSGSEVLGSGLQHRCMLAETFLVSRPLWLLNVSQRQKSKYLKNRLKKSWHGEQVIKNGVHYKWLRTEMLIMERTWLYRGIRGRHLGRGVLRKKDPQRDRERVLYISRAIKQSMWIKIEKLVRNQLARTAGCIMSSPFMSAWKDEC